MLEHVADFLVECERSYVKVLSVDLAVLGLVEVLLRDHDTLTEKVLMDLLAVGLGDQPGTKLAIEIVRIFVLVVMRTFWRY